jgi:6 kDa early secretory antigenic target
MGDQINVSFAELAALGDQIASVTSQIENELDSLRQQIANVDALWTGAAGSGYQQTKSQWNTAATDLSSVLASIGAAVRAAEQSYSATESKNASAWQ